MERFEKIQYQTALAITGTWQGSSRISLYQELGWETLTVRRWHSSFTQIYKIRNNRTSDYLRNNLPPIRNLCTYAASKILTTICPVGKPNIKIAFRTSKLVDPWIILSLISFL